MKFNQKTKRIFTMFSAIQFLKIFGKLPYLVKSKIFGNTIFYLERCSVSVSQRSTGRHGEKSLSFILCWHPDMMANTNRQPCERKPFTGNACLLHNRYCLLTIGRNHIKILPTLINYRPQQ